MPKNPDSSLISICYFVIMFVLILIVFKSLGTKKKETFWIDENIARFQKPPESVIKPRAYKEYEELCNKAKKESKKLTELQYFEKVFKTVNKDTDLT